MLQVTQLIGFMATTLGPVISLSYVGSLSTATDASTYSGGTFASQSIGAEAGAGERRYTVLAIGGTAANATNIRHVTGGSAGGVSGTLISENNVEGTTCGLVLVADPVGTTGITLSFDNTMTAAGVSIYRLIVPSNATVVAGTPQEDTADPLNWTVPSVAAGGIIIGISQTQEGGTEDHSHTWTELTENFDADINSDEWMSTASKEYASAASSVNISADATGSPDRMVGITCAFNPQSS